MSDIVRAWYLVSAGGVGDDLDVLEVAHATKEAAFDAARALAAMSGAPARVLRVTEVAIVQPSRVRNGS